ncbi:hypothetical protein CDL15_Pgr016345 [Punica granatum]|uniref:Uncharacterized protein n=1 Tax=Punica granatum TaxID=22663 RepID=A0A218W5U9_PUNGR|nr:hypothetical protein CDL15_Pgr016345 [Punica granatum]
MALRIFTFFSSIAMATVLLSTFQYTTVAARQLRGETAYLAVATLQSTLHKGKVPPSGNPCTNIPRSDSGVCKLTEKNFAGSRLGGHPLPLAYTMTQAATVASVTIGTTDQKAAHQRS